MADKPTSMMLWTDVQRQQWLTKLNEACVPFNEVLACTERSGGRRWWMCFSDEQLIELLEGEDSGDMPKEPFALRTLFNALADICEPRLATSFADHHPCMRRIFSNNKNAVVQPLKQQAIQVDDQTKEKCVQYNCQSAKTYVNVMTHIVANGCNNGPIDTVVKFLQPSLALRMHDTSVYCSEDEFPKDVESGDYASMPSQNPLTLMTKLKDTCDSGSAPAPAPAPVPATTVATTKRTPPPPPPRTTIRATAPPGRPGVQPTIPPAPPAWRPGAATTPRNEGDSPSENGGGRDFPLDEHGYMYFAYGVISLYEVDYMDSKATPVMHPSLSVIFLAITLLITL